MSSSSTPKPQNAEQVLIVDDEEDITELLSFNLLRAGYNVLVAQNGTEALSAAKKHKPAVILLDLNLPDMSGIQVYKKLRNDPETKDSRVIMVTAKGEEIDRVVGFELGVDDYIVKPFSPREVVLRVGAVLRRSVPPGTLTPGKEENDSEINIGILSVDTSKHRVLVNAQDVDLTLLEFKLLYDLLTKPGKVQHRDALLERVWGYSSHVESRTVDTHVKRLREKLGDARDYIETVRGVGYKFKDDISIQLRDLETD